MDIRTLFGFTALTLALLSAPARAGNTSAVHSADVMLTASTDQTAKESAATVTPDAISELQDHYGNPDSFIRYIISKPPIHA